MSLRRAAGACLFLLAFVACKKPIPAPTQAEAVDEATKRILSTKEFPFCKPTEAAMPPYDRDWCAIQEEATTCPQIKEMCAREWGSSTSKDGSSWSMSSKSKQATKVGEGESGGAFDRMGFSLPDMPWVGVLMWVGIGLVIAFVAFMIIRAIASRQKIEEPEFEKDEDEPAPMELVYADPGLGEVATLLAKARAAADNDVGQALSLLYAASLRYLEDKGFIRWETSATNRQYVREIRGKTPLDRPVAELVREVERVKFGRRAPHRSVFDGLYQRISSGLSSLVLIGITSSLLAACGDYGNPDLDGRAAFNELLKSQGITPSRFARPLDKVSADDPPIILDTRQLAIDSALLESVERAVVAGGRILLIVDRDTKWPSWPYLGITEAEAREIKPSSEWAKERGLNPSRAGVLPKSLVITPDPKERDRPDVLIERGGQPFAVRWRSDGGELVVVADRMLFSNGALAVPANAELAFALAKEIVGEKKELAAAVLGPASGADSPVTSLNRAGVLPLMLQALLAVGILFIARGAAFGVLRSPEVRMRRSFSEHVRALGLQFARNKGSRYAAYLFSSYAIERLWQRTGRETDRNDPNALAAVLAPRVGLSLESVRDTLEAAELLRREPNGISVPERDLNLIRQLTDLLQRSEPAAVRSNDKRRAA